MMRKVLLLIAFASCSVGYPQWAAAGERPLVVASIEPLALLLRELAGPAVEVRTLLDAGSDPHHSRLRPSQAGLLARADLVVWVGMEAGLGKTLARFPAEKQLRWQQSHDHHDHHDGSDHDGREELHPWLDVEAVDEFAARLAKLLAALPGGDAKLPALARQLSVQLRTLRVSPALPGALAVRKVLVDHQAYAPLLARWQVESLGSIRGQGHRAPGARRLAALRALQGVDAVLSGSPGDPLVQRLAEHHEAVVISVDLLARDTYPSFSAYYRSLLESLSKGLAEREKGGG